MKPAHTLYLAISFACAGSVHAQTCSGGTDGGMDATGNQCNTPGAFAAQQAESVTPSPAAHVATRADRAVSGVPATKIAMVARRNETVAKKRAHARP